MPHYCVVISNSNHFQKRPSTILMIMIMVSIIIHVCSCIFRCSLFIFPSIVGVLVRLPHVFSVQSLTLHGSNFYIHFYSFSKLCGCVCRSVCVYYYTYLSKP